MANIRTSESARRTTLFLAICALIASLGIPSTVSSADDFGDRILISNQKNCDPSTDSTDVYSGSEVDIAEQTDWILGHKAQSDIDPLHEVADRYDVLGVYIDDAAREIVVADNPAISNTSRLELIAQDLEDSTNSINIRVEIGCHSTKDLEYVNTYLMDEQLHDTWDIQAISAYIDPDIGAVVVTLSDRDDEFADHLSEKFGDLVEVNRTPGGPSRSAGSRLNDVSPHYGASRIAPRSFPGASCTSGLAADVQGGPRIMVTAGHCAHANNAGMVNGAGGDYGVLRMRHISPFDVARINGRTYHRYIWNTSTGTRLIDGKMSNIPPGREVCVSGSVSGSICSIRVSSTDAWLCDDEGCTVGLHRATSLSGVNVVRPGDSGGPAYGRTGSNTADARGIIVGSECGRNPCPTVLLHSVSQIENTLNVRIATQASLEW